MNASLQTGAVVGAQHRLQQSPRKHMPFARRLLVRCNVIENVPLKAVTNGILHFDIIVGGQIQTDPNVRIDDTFVRCVGIQHHLKAIDQLSSDHWRCVQVQFLHIIGLIEKIGNYYREIYCIFFPIPYVLQQILADV